MSDVKVNNTGYPEGDPTLSPGVGPDASVAPGRDPVMQDPDPAPGGADEAREAAGRISVRQPNYMLWAGLTLVGALLLMMLISLVWTPHNPLATSSDFRMQLQPPSARYPFGTDHLGRDVLSRAMIASQTVFLIGVSTLVISGSIGITLGLIAGYKGGWVDIIIMRFIEVFSTIPGTIQLLLFITIFGRGTTQTIIAISVMSFTSFARLVRSRVLSLRQQEHIMWAKVIGASPLRIIVQHIMPDLIPLILVISANQFSSAVMAEAGLSYLGLGVQPPQPSWGNMLTRAQAGLLTNPWNAIIPGILITLLVVGFNLTADGLSRRYNIKER